MSVPCGFLPTRFIYQHLSGLMELTLRSTLTCVFLLSNRVCPDSVVAHNELNHIARETCPVFRLSR
jgi:hypothetical protein